MYQEYKECFLKALEEVRIYQNTTEITTYEMGMKALVDAVTEKKKSGNKMFFVGNGGSAAIASHMTADFMKNGEIKTQNFYDLSTVTCIGNDYGYENVFARPLQLYGEAKDMLVAISSSGNSKSIVNAVGVAREKGMEVITFSGFEKSNKIIGMGNYNVYVPISHYGVVESIHNMLLQQIVDEILDRDGLLLEEEKL